MSKSWSATCFKNTKKACERYQHFSKEEKEKKQQQHRERHKNLSNDEKNKLFELSIEEDIGKWEKTFALKKQRFRKFF